MTAIIIIFISVSIASYFTLLRPLNAFIAFGSVYLGYFTAMSRSDSPPRMLLLLAGLSAFFIAGFGNVLNDLLDLPADRLNRPDRPLPSGRVESRGAFFLSTLLLLLGFLCARLVSPGYLFMAFGVAALLWLYNGFLKRVALVGNLLVAGLTGFTLLYGGLLATSWGLSLIPALFASLLNLARELVKTALDRSGDEAVGYRTFAVRFGERGCTGFAAGVLLLFCGLVPLPYLFGIYNMKYMLLAGGGVLLPSLLLVVQLFKPFDAKRARTITVLLKGVMILGLLSVLIGKGAVVCGHAFSESAVPL